MQQSNMLLKTPGTLPVRYKYSTPHLSKNRQTLQVLFKANKSKSVVYQQIK
uniref:Uncharacterized protein n=1 Tax=Anguilla anguilla TaxID=7936 RepID=A0A0E9WNM8_ANGAN